MRRRVGIYPGSFDPVHEGHVAFVSEALGTCKLDEAIFLPDPLPRGKPSVTHITKRVARLNEVAASVEATRVMHLDGGSFTVEHTLPRLKELIGDAELVFLIGSDVVRTFLYRWDNLDILLRDVSLAIGMRGDDRPDEMAAIMRELEKTYDFPISYKLIFTEYAHLSSSQLRQ